jgi:hypothetical protein
MINKGKMQEGRLSTVIAMKVYYQQSSRAKHLVNRRWYLHKLQPKMKKNTALGGLPLTKPDILWVLLVVLKLSQIVGDGI